MDLQAKKSVVSNCARLALSYSKAAVRNPDDKRFREIANAWMADARYYRDYPKGAL